MLFTSPNKQYYVVLVVKLLMMFSYLLLLNNSRNTYSRHLKFGMVIVILFTSPNEQYYVILFCCKVIDYLSLLLFRHITSFSCQIKLYDYVKITIYIDAHNFNHVDFVVLEHYLITITVTVTITIVYSTCLFLLFCNNMSRMIEQHAMPVLYTSPPIPHGIHRIRVISVQNPIKVLAVLAQS